MELAINSGRGLCLSIFPIPDRVCYECNLDEQPFFSLQYTFLGIHRNISIQLLECKKQVVTFYFVEWLRKFVSRKRVNKVKLNRYALSLFSNHFGHLIVLTVPFDCVHGLVVRKKNRKRLREGREGNQQNERVSRS